MPDASRSTMERTLVTCPETGCPERVELERTPVGTVVEGCSRFSPHETVTCSRRCAATIDRVDRDALDERVLVACANADGQTAALARALAAALGRDRLLVELAELAAGGAPPAIDYDSVVVVARVRFSRLPRCAVAWLAANRDALLAMPAWAVVIGPEPRVVHALDRAGWRPERIATFERRAWSAGVPLDEADRIDALARAIGEDVPVRP